MHEGCCRMRAPFSYLQEFRNWIRDSGEAEEIQGDSKTKTSSLIATGFVRTECSLTVLCCGEDRIRTCGTGYPVQLLSRQPRSSTLAPPQYMQLSYHAEGVGFEPTVARSTTLVFKTNALNRSAILP